ncbi:MAG: extracellular solute-binding protein [Clostridia bacterium]|nr:extracellular solute-binding protein [Clostridia bacterium]
MKKYLTVFLALLLASSALLTACGEGNTETDRDPSADTEPSAATEMETETKLRDSLPDDLDFGGVSVTFHARGDEVPMLEIEAEDMTGDVINDAYYNRNISIEERLNLDIVLYAAESWAKYDMAMTDLAASIQSGDGAYQVVAGWVSGVTPMALEGYFMDLSDAPYLDLEKPWWNQEATETLRIGGVMNFIGGDVCFYSGLAGAFVYFQNDELAENYGIPSIPDMVRENEWTMDAAIGITKEIYVDTDGNGTMDTNDTYGIVNGAWACADGYYTAADIHQIVIDEKGMPALVPQQERIAKLLETIAPFWLDPASAGAYCVWGGPEVDMFINNQTLLSAFELDAGVYSFRDMDASYTILPYPKLDDTQDYRTNATNGATLMAIPVDNTERLDASCAAMEAIAAYNHLNIVDIYIETCLQEKFARNEDTVDMLNLIRESICMDVEHMFKAVLGETMYVVRDLLIDSKNTNIASWYASKTTGIESAIQSTIATIEEMQ